MTRLGLYAAIYVVLFVLATVQVAFEGVLEAAYWPIFALIMAVSLAKAVVVAGYFQHLRWEPRSLSYLMLVGLAAALALTLAAAYSIT
jgi:cytochrome c oxidase subunit 4